MKKEEKNRKLNKSTLLINQFKNSIPVHILYLTVFGKDGGPIQFRKDIYERDGEIATALSLSPSQL